MSVKTATYKKMYRKSLFSEGSLIKIESRIGEKAGQQTERIQINAGGLSAASQQTLHLS